MGAAETAVSSALSCYHLLSLLIFDIRMILIFRNSDGERGLAKWCPLKEKLNVADEYLNRCLRGRAHLL